MLLGLGNGEGQSVQSIFETGRLHIHDILVQVCGLEAGGRLLTGSRLVFQTRGFNLAEWLSSRNSLGWVVGLFFQARWLVELVIVARELDVLIR